MPAEKRAPATRESTDIVSDSTGQKPEKKKLQPFLDSGQIVEDTEPEGIGFDPIPPIDAVDQ